MRGFLGVGSVAALAVSLAEEGESEDAVIAESGAEDLFCLGVNDGGEHHGGELGLDAGFTVDERPGGVFERLGGRRLASGLEGFDSGGLEGCGVGAGAGSRRWDGATTGMGAGTGWAGRRERVPVWERPEPRDGRRLRHRLRS